MTRKLKCFSGPFVLVLVRCIDRLCKTTHVVAVGHAVYTSSVLDYNRPLNSERRWRLFGRQALAKWLGLETGVRKCTYIETLYCSILRNSQE
ncbi:hypothetical protein C8F01DRAFT_271564, partial [Mycena amicta]